MSRRCREFVDPLYESVAHRVFAKEAGAPDYDTKVHEWKTFQERNLVRSGIVAAGGIAGNLATQKWLLGNPSPTGVIFAGKMASTAISTAMGLVVRLAFPRHMDALDARISKTFFAPFLQDRHLDTAPEAAPGAITSQAERLRRMTDEYMGLAR